MSVCWCVILSCLCLLFTLASFQCFFYHGFVCCSLLFIFRGCGDKMMICVFQFSCFIYSFSPVYVIYSLDIKVKRNSQLNPKSLLDIIFFSFLVVSVSVYYDCLEGVSEIKLNLFVLFSLLSIVFILHLIFTVFFLSANTKIRECHKEALDINPHFYHFRLLIIVLAVSYLQ